MTGSLSHSGGRAGAPLPAAAFLLAAAALGLALATALPARAEVVAVASDHATVRQAAHVHEQPQRVWKLLTNEIGRWWSPAHTWSGEAKNLSLEARPGGCFCEKLPDGGVRHLEVVHAKPPEMLRLAGALGPLQELALTGAMTWALAPVGDGCDVTVTYRLAGHAQGESGLAEWAPLVDRVLGEQVERLRRYVETGSPEAPPRAPAQPEP
jgi:uncharacterized protein YndB with AHSA1/START domain